MKLVGTGPVNIAELTMKASSRFAVTGFSSYQFWYHCIRNIFIPLYTILLYNYTIHSTVIQ